MKITAVLLTIVCLHAAAGGFTQTITISIKNAPLEKIFGEIKKQTHYEFVYRWELLQNTRPVDIDVKDMPIKDVLDICFKDQRLSYNIVDNLIVLSEKAEQKDISPPLLPLIDITGKITDKEGNPLAGANVKVKGTTNGTSTNERGEFTLTGVDENAVLEISFVGYDSQTLAVKNKGKINVSLEVSIKELDVTVIKGYYNTTKRLNTGNVSKVTAETISRQPVSNPIVALEGLVPGMIVNQSSGLPGSNISIQIRGQNSLTQGNDPLFLIDGVPFNGKSLDKYNSGFGPTGQSPFNSINPADIESIEVLKDADATAIYGSRGANGVILITTKRGKSGKSRISGSFYAGYGKVSHTMNYLNTQQYLQIRREAFLNDGVTPTTTNAPDLLVWDTTRNTNWKNILIGGTAKISDAQLSYSGGNIQTQFLIGTNYHRETTVFPGDLSDNRIGFHVNLNQNSNNNKFNSIFSAIYSNDKNNLIGTDLTAYLNTVPDAPSPYDQNGNLNWSEKGVYFNNPLAFTLQKYAGNTNNLLSNLTLKYNLIKGLQLKTNLGYTYTDLRQNIKFPKAAKNPSSNPTGSATFTRNNYSSWIVEPQAEYILKYRYFNLTFLAGTTFEKDVTDGSRIDASNYSSDALLSSIVGAGTINASISRAVYKYESIFGHANINYQDKYVLNLTARRDGSTRFGPGRQFANFGSVGFAWIFSNENFTKPVLPVLSYGKLRTSYGTTGNDKIGDYLFLDTWNTAIGFGSTGYQGISGFQPGRLFNPDYAWEINKKLEIAVDLGFFKDKMLLSTSFYRNRSSNQLIAYTLPTQTGFTSIFRNFPALVQNSGWEFQLVSTNFKNKHFKWSTDLNVTIARNKLLEFPDLATSSYANQFVVGEPITILKLLKYQGVDPQTGLFTFNGTSRPKDQISIKNIAPQYYGGLQNSFQFEGFQLDIFFQFTKQNGFNYLTTTSAPGNMQNQPINVLNHWVKPGDLSALQKFTTSTSNATAVAYSNYILYSDARITDASFIRLRNLMLSYTFPLKVTNSIKAESIRWYVQGQNLATITHYKGNDPELSRTSSIYLPPLRVMATGILFNF